jgi:hypothetical protein
MDERKFGEWTKQIAAVASRRGIGRVLGAGVLGLALAARGAAEVEGAFGFCSAPGTKCSKDKKCCSGNCKGNGTCGCRGKGAPCINHVGIACCSQTCRDGKCA